MDFSDESYVRLYVRDTKTWLRLGFEGQCVLMFLLRKLDRAGVLDGMDEPESDVALVTGVWLDIVRVGLARLLEFKVFEHVGNRLIMPNYIAAQTAIRSDRARQRDSREKRSAEARAVTPRDEMSHAVTGGHAPSHPVTLYCALPNCTDPSFALLDPEASAEPRVIHNGGGARWSSFPKGWRWSDETTAAAAMVGVTPAQLQEHVDYWTLRDFSGGGVNDLDGELRRSLGTIRERGETARAKALRAKQAPARPSFGSPLPLLEPDRKQLAYAERHGLDATAIAAELIREGVVDALGLGRARELITERLRGAVREKAGAA